MYAMGLAGLLLAVLVALGAAFGFFSADGSADAARLTAERYMQTRSILARAVQDGVARSPGLSPGTEVLEGLTAIECAAPWTAQTDCALPLGADMVAGIMLFAPEGWTPQLQADGSTARWNARLHEGRLFVSGPADAKEMAAIRTASRHVYGVSWCPPVTGGGNGDGDACAPPLPGVVFPAGVSAANSSTVVSVTELGLPTP